MSYTRLIEERTYIVYFYPAYNSRENIKNMLVESFRYSMGLVGK